ncbi:MAG: hypothetical protein WBQ15_08815 [Candidatus Sulfotelmatobacter sp.]
MSIDATNVIRQPVIDELYEALSVRTLKADHRVTLLELREAVKKL